MTVAEIFETMEYGPAPEAKGPALAWLDRHRRTFGHFIGGDFVPGTAHFDSVNPATGRMNDGSVGNLVGLPATTFAPSSSERATCSATCAGDHFPGARGVFQFG